MSVSKFHTWHAATMSLVTKLINNYVAELLYRAAHMVLCATLARLYIQCEKHRNYIYYDV